MKIIEIIWSRDVINTWVFALYFGILFHNLGPRLYVLNCFKYIFLDKCPKKSDQKKIWTIDKNVSTISSVKMTRYSKRF